MGIDVTFQDSWKIYKTKKIKYFFKLNIANIHYMYYGPPHRCLETTLNIVCCILFLFANFVLLLFMHSVLSVVLTWRLDSFTYQLVIWDECIIQRRSFFFLSDNRLSIWVLWSFTAEPQASIQQYIVPNRHASYTTLQLITLFSFAILTLLNMQFDYYINKYKALSAFVFFFYIFIFFLNCYLLFCVGSRLVRRSFRTHT